MANTPFPNSAAGWLAIGIAVAVASSDARAERCAAASPACHLENGKQLLDSDPRRAADELLASYQLDERTDTLTLYAIALERAGRHALALETWKRVIVFRDSELEAAKETARSATGRKLAAARTAATRAQKQSEQAANAILQLLPRTARVRIHFAPGQALSVSHDGVEVDASRDVIVNAGRDELIFTSKDGSVSHVAVEVASGALAKLDAPSGQLASARQPEAEPSRASKPESASEPTRAEAAPTGESSRPSKLEASAKPRSIDVETPIKPEPVPVKPAMREPETVAVRYADEPRSPAMSYVGVGLVAGAVVAGGVAGTFGWLASRDYDDAGKLGCASGKCPIGPVADLAQRSNDRARVAQITAVAGGALLATGVTLWLVGRGKTRHAVSDLALHVGPSSTAISGRF